jgi:hypothetical protein
MISHNEARIDLLKRQEPEFAAIYEHMGCGSRESRRSNSAFLSYESALDDVRDGWEADEMPFFRIEKVYVGDRGEY